jgi:two-component system nitrate/nitrite response regulator NarL
MTRISVGIVDDHPLMLESIGAFLAGSGRFDIVATGKSAADIYEIAGAHHPDIMIVDLSMPGDVFQAILDASLSAPDTKAIVFTAADNADQAVQALAARARGYVLKGSPGSDLIEAIDATDRNEIYISPVLAIRMIGALQLRAMAAKARLRVKLSGREQQVVELLLAGRKNNEISQALSITEKTVKSYMTNLMIKLNARNRIEVILAVKKLGLVA